MGGLIVLLISIIVGFVVGGMVAAILSESNSKGSLDDED